MRLLLSLLALFPAACGGGSGVTPDPGPAQAIHDFMQAVADSNLARMAQLWGTRSGPAATTRQPSDYQQRIQVMHAYLKGATARVISQIEGSSDRTTLHVEMSRGGCVRNVPFVLVRLSGNRWIVMNVDIAAIGTPGRDCPMENRRPPG